MNRSPGRSIWPRPLITLLLALALTFAWIVLHDSAVLTAPHAISASFAKIGSLPNGKFRSDHS